MCGEKNEIFENLQTFKENSYIPITTTEKHSTKTGLLSRWSFLCSLQVAQRWAETKCIDS